MRRTLPFLVTALLFACTTTTTQVTPGSGNGAAPDPSTLPEISADKLGKACAGFGTGIGQTALFKDDDCASGFCLVDARTGLDEYCSADCEKVRCPAGWTCEAIDNGSTGHACFQDPTSAAPPPPAAPTSYLDKELTGYHARTSKTAMLKLRDYADATRAKNDLVIAVLHGPWAIYSTNMMDSLVASPPARTAIVVVLVEGDGPSVPAKTSDLTAFHGKYAGLDVMLDPELATLTPLGPLQALPAYVAFDAKTLKEVGRDMGFTEDAFATMVEDWRAKAKAIK